MRREVREADSVPRVATDRTYVRSAVEREKEKDASERIASIMYRSSCPRAFIQHERRAVPLS